MRRLIHSLVLLLFCFHTGCFSNPLPDTVKAYGWNYAYNGEIETTTTACNESLARWSISGNLSLYYHHEDYMVVKLDDVKTSLFNGPRSNLQHVQEKEIPEESKAIMQQFLIKKIEDKSLRIFLKPNEPLWSVNMKKAMASYLNFGIDVFTNEKSEVKSNEKIKKPFEEQSIYGKCTGDITMEKMESDSHNMTVYSKKLNYWNCTDRPLDQHTNTLKPLGSIEMFEFLDFESSNVLMMDANQEVMLKGSSKTNISYKIMHSSPYSLHTVQRQTFTLQESLEDKVSIDISELTDERNLIYEFGDEPSSGRHTYETDQSVLAKNYLENYDLFKKHFDRPSLENYDIRKSDPVEKMFLILMTMDNQGLKNLESAIRERKDYDFESFHFALLPYIGTNATVKYLSKTLQIVPNHGNSASLLTTLAVFPRNIRYPTDDILENLEPFMDLKNMEQQTVKSAAVLSFASAIGRACKKSTISKKYITKYIDMFNSKYLGGENSEERMTHLLGLVNMAECLDADFMNGIATNTSESGYLRALAITGFKHELRYQPSKQVFDIYWPIIQKKTEPYDVRVAALDFLLSTYPSEANFDLIVERYSKQLNEPEDKQLANYLLTSLHSLQNTNWYINNYLGAKATKYVKNNRIPPYPKAWATGYYRLSYTDIEPNVGAYFDIRLITDPKTNIINAIQLTFNNFASSFDFGTYSLYLKIDGLMNWTYALKYIKSIEVSSVPELLKSLKNNKFELKGLSKHFRADIILFVDRVAVYAKHIHNGDQDEINSIGEELEDFASYERYISYPVLDYTHMPSGLGTPILITNYLQDISNHSLDHYIRYRSSWSFQTWIEAYNPLVDTNIASYKYYVDEKNLKIKFASNMSVTPTFTWEIENDTYSQFWDSMMGTAVEEEEVLKQYCQDCKPFNELSTDIYNGYTYDMEPFGLEIEVSRHSHKKNQYTTLSEFYHGNIHQPNVDAFPYAAPILLLSHMETRKLWLKSELQRGSYISHPSSGPNSTSQTTFKLNAKGNIRNRFRMTSHMDIHAGVKTKNLVDDKVLSYANMTYAFSWLDNIKDEEGNEKLALYETFNFKFISTNDRRSVKICGNRENFFPGLRGDKLSLEPFEAATGETVLISAKNIEDDEDCIPDRVFTLKEVYSASNKEKILEDEYMKKDYNKCVSDSKDLKFTAPTAECKRVSSRLTEYDNYKVYLKSVAYFEDGRNKTDELKQPFFECSRVGTDKLKLALLKLPWIPQEPEDPYYSYTTYFPKKTVDPNWLAYNEHDIAIPVVATSTCTIAPSAIEQFSGKYIANPKKEWLAFAECYNVSTRGLIGHTIGDQHVGFTFYSNEHVLTATVKDGKALIKINGTVQNEFNDPFEHFRVHHLDENVFHVRDAKVDIYYNTEYISVKVPSMYDNLLCGVCTQDH